MHTQVVARSIPCAVTKNMHAAMPLSVSRAARESACALAADVVPAAFDPLTSTCHASPF